MSQICHSYQMVVYLLIESYLRSIPPVTLSLPRSNHLNTIYIYVCSHFVAMEFGYSQIHVTIIKYFFRF